MDEKKSWKSLAVKEKIQYILAIVLVAASIIISFTSFFILLEIPNSVIATNGLWLATACGILGISIYFHNSLVNYQAKIDKELNNLDETISRKIREEK